MSIGKLVNCIEADDSQMVAALDWITRKMVQSLGIPAAMLGVERPEIFKPESGTDAPLISVCPYMANWEGFTYPDGGREGSTAETLNECLDALAAHHGKRAADFRAIEVTSGKGWGQGYIFQAVSRAACEDCKGTGRYVGLNAVEPCGTCGGSGKVSP